MDHGLGITYHPTAASLPSTAAGTAAATVGGSGSGSGGAMTAAGPAAIENSLVHGLTSARPPNDKAQLSKADRRALQVLIFLLDHKALAFFLIMSQQEQQRAAKIAAKASNAAKSKQAQQHGGNTGGQGTSGGGGVGRRGSTINLRASSAGTIPQGGSSAMAPNNSNSTHSGSGGGGGGGANARDAQHRGKGGSVGAKHVTTGNKLTARTPSSQSQRGLQFFSHLPVAEEALRYTSGLRARLKSKDVVIHPAILALALQYSRMHIIGSNARCLAMLQAFREVISDYSIPENQTLSRHLESYLKPQIDYLTKARALSVGMGSAIRQLKIRISKSEPNLPEDDVSLSL